MIGKTISHYRILEELGRGGMGVVYKAEDTRLKRTVALKFLPPELTRDEEARKRFLYEARAASALEHNNICNIHEINETRDGQTFIAMACYEGETLKDKLLRGPLNIEDAVDITIQIAQGLEKAHLKGIFHRDIKPANIFITQDGIVKIVDFGLAKLSGKTTLTKTGRTPGTVTYMSPEQTRGNDVDFRTDIWSLGIVLYEMLLGQPPFKGDYEQAVIYSILNEDPDLQILYDSNISPKMISLIKKTLNKNPDDRYRSIAEIKTFLIRNRESITGRQADSAAEKKLIPPRQWIRKHAWFSVLVFSIPLFLYLLSLIMKPNITLGPNDYILLSEFANHTNENVFDHSLTEALRVTLLQSPEINILPDDRIQNVLTQMRKPVSQKLNEALSLEISKREGIPVAVSGRIDKIGNNYILSGKIIDVARREPVDIIRVEVSQIEDVLSGMDKLARNIRKGLGESLRIITRTSESLKNVTTPSLEALEFYSRGERLEKQGNFLEAIELKKQAIAIDSQFVMAISDLSYCYRKTGNHEMAVSCHNRILPLIDRVTNRERYSILIFYYGPFFEQDYPKAFQYARQWISLYPNDAYGHATQAHLAFYSGEYDISLQSSRKAMSLDSSLTGICYSNMGYAYALSGNHKEALACFRKSKQIRPQYLTLDSYIMHTYWMRNSLDSAEVQLKGILDRVDLMTKVKTYAELTALYHFQGRYRQAREACESGIKLCQDAHKPGDESYLIYLLGEIERDRGHTTQFTQIMERALNLSQSPFLEVALAGVSFAQEGFKGKALQCIYRIRTADSLDPYFTKRKISFENAIQGNIWMKEGAYQNAIACFRQVDKIYSGDPMYWMAQKDIGACMAFMKDSSVIRHYQNILNHSGEIFMGFLPSIRKGGFWTSRLLPELMFDLGKEYIAIKDTTQTVKVFQKVQKIWTEADDDFQKLKVIESYLDQFLKKDYF